METKKDDLVNEALELVSEREKFAKNMHIYSWCAIVLALFLTGIFVYGQIKAGDIRSHADMLYEKHQDSEAAKLINKIVSRRIDLLHAELKLRYHVSGMVGAVLLGLGIAGLLTRKQKIREARVFKGIIQLVGKAPNN